MRNAADNLKSITRLPHPFRISIQGFRGFSRSRRLIENRTMKAAVRLYGRVLEFEENQMKKALAALLVAIGSASSPALTIQIAQAQSSMLARGIYTTPEISARCQAYTRSRNPGSGTMDSTRQAVFLACVRKLYRDEQGGGSASATQGAIISEPVSMQSYGEPYLLDEPYHLIGGPHRFGCTTDEGYGRTGTCDTNHQ
jgi:hypothetical protein